jgi:bifunctional DNA-binding transcriptional regulator/antitoxin component of YhaV-PrlF toxin-antitoxin module
MITRRISSKAQTTPPRAVRIALGVGVGVGDELAYEIKDDAVVIRRAGRKPAEDLFALFDEWASDADTRAYAEL